MSTNNHIPYDAVSCCLTVSILSVSLLSTFTTTKKTPLNKKAGLASVFQLIALLLSHTVRLEFTQYWCELEIQSFSHLAVRLNVCQSVS